MRIASSVLVTALALSVAAPAFAQATGTSSSRQRPSTPKPAKPPLPKPKLNIRAFGAFDAEWMSASKSFDAVTGSALVLAYGGGGELLNVWRGLFVRGDYVTSSTKGDRVFVIGDDVISTGVPITVGLDTFEVAFGWRLGTRKHPRFTPYAGAAVLFVKYSEHSEFEQPTDTVNESFTGYAVLGGVDIGMSKRIFLTAEAQYRLVPNALGDAGVSRIYDEHDLGGVAARLMVGYNFRK